MTNDDTTDSDGSARSFDFGGAGPLADLPRAVLGILVAVIVLAVVLALWFLFTGGDDTATELNTDTGEVSATIPTPLPIPTSTPAPAIDEPAATPTPAVTATPIPEGFEACGDERGPIVTATYIVDTLTTPLNQRAEPSVSGELVGTFEPAETGLTFTGECVVNITDGYVWWQIDNGTELVWVARDFVSPN